MKSLITALSRIREIAKLKPTQMAVELDNPDCTYMIVNDDLYLNIFHSSMDDLMSYNECDEEPRPLEGLLFPVCEGFGILNIEDDRDYLYELEEDGSIRITDVDGNSESFEYDSEEYLPYMETMLSLAQKQIRAAK